MSAADDRLNELLSQSYELEEGPSRVSLLEAAVNEADSLADVERGYETRMELIHSATFSGYHEKALVAFAWCLSQADEDPQRFDEESLLWQYKWVLDSIPAFPQVTREQIARMQQDFERRLLRLGYSPRPAYYLRWSNAMRMGRWEELSGDVEQWRSAPRDDLADCLACECNKCVELCVRRGQDEAALHEAAPILDGRQSCAEIPHVTLAILLRPLLRLKRLDQAARLHRQGYRLIATNREFAGRIAEHLLFLVRARKLEKAARLFERHLPWALETANLDNRFLFYSAAELFLESAEAGKRWPNACRHLPDELAGLDSAGLADWFRSQAADLAAQFDRRNGNAYYAEQLQDARRLASG